MNDDIEINLRIEAPCMIRIAIRREIADSIAELPEEWRVREIHSRGYSAQHDDYSAEVDVEIWADGTVQIRALGRSVSAVGYGSRRDQRRRRDGPGGDGGIVTRAEAHRWMLGAVEIKPSYSLGFVPVVLAFEGEDDLIVKVAAHDPDGVTDRGEQRDARRSISDYDRERGKPPSMLVMIQQPRLLVPWG